MTMAFLPVLLLLILGLPFLLFLLYFNVAALSFAKLGLSPEGAFLLFSASLIGGVINIPVWREQVYVRPSPTRVFPFLYYYPPAVQERVIAVNVGGAVIPSLFALYLLTRTPLDTALLATLVVTVVARSLARPVPGVGITMPAFIPPLAAAVTALLIGGEYAAPVAYISGVLGTLIGADLLNLRAIRGLGAQVMSIGGAGIFDGIFLVGVVAAFLS